MSGPMSLTSFLTSLNVLVSSVVAIIAFSLLAYTLTYNFRNTVARRYAVVLLCVMVVYSCDVALDRVVTAESAGRWLRMQWFGKGRMGEMLLSSTQLSWVDTLHTHPAIVLLSGSFASYTGGDWRIEWQRDPLRMRIYKNELVASIDWQRL